MEAVRRKDISKERNQLYKLQGGRWDMGGGREQARSEILSLFPQYREAQPPEDWPSGDNKGAQI